MNMMCTQFLHTKHHVIPGGWARGATMQVLGRQPPPAPTPQRGLRPTVRCQRYRLKELMGAKGAQLSTFTGTTTLNA